MGRNGRLLVAVSLVASFGGSAMSLTAAVWVKTLTGSSGLAGLTAFFVYAPTLAGPALGTVVDRLPSRAVLVWTNLSIVALLLSLWGVHHAGQVWLVYVVMLGYGVRHVLVGAAEARLVTASLPRDALGGLNGARMSAQEATRLVAPLGGAALFAWSGGPAVALIAAGSLVLAVLLYGGVRPRPDLPAPPPRRPLWSETRDGLRFLLAEPLLRVPVAVAAVAMLASGLGNAAVYTIVDTSLHRPATFVGALASVQGAGSILAGLVADRLMTRLGETAVAAVGAVVFALGRAAQAIGWLPAVVAGTALIGIGLPWAVVASLTAVQRHTPIHLLGRVAASANTAVFGAPAVGIPLGAWAVSFMGAAVPLTTAGLAAALAGLAGGLVAARATAAI